MSPIARGSKKAEKRALQNEDKNACNRPAAANRRNFDSATRLFWLKTTLVLAFEIGLLMSPRLWIGPRSYPLAPVSSALPDIDGLLAYGLFAALFVLAILILVAAKPRRFIAAFLTLIVAFCLADQTRWQPWIFLYGFLLGTLQLFSWNSADSGGLNNTLNLARLIVACTYIFSGLQKVNLNFMENDFPWMVQPITNLFPRAASPLHVFGMIVPFVQVTFGVGLLTKRFRSISLIVAIIMHVFILTMFGPLGHDWNSIIWSWTAAMAVFDVILFTNESEDSIAKVLWTQRRLDHVVVLIVFVVLPCLSFFNLWDSYLSAALYSGNLTEAEIYLSDAGAASLPESIKQRSVRTSADTNVINLQRWAIEDLNVTPYPETRVYKAIAKTVCGYLRDRKQLVLIVREQRLYLSKPETGYRCSEL
jgi:hypothetical protein